MAVAIPALLLFALMLLGAVLLSRPNFEQPTSTARWVGSAAFVLSSAGIVWALFRALFRGSRKVSPRVSGPKLDRGDVIVSWRFTPRWKEELACASTEGEVVLEMMMIEAHVYFPTADTWARQAPSWAKNRRDDLLAELEQWCTTRSIPLTVDEKAWVAAR